MPLPPPNARGLFPGALEMMILRILQRESIHGYALAQRIKDASGDLLQVEEGSLYPALQRMLKEKWVAAEWRTSDRNRRIRVYRIMPSGEKRLKTELASFERMLTGVARVLTPVES